MLPRSGSLVALLVAALAAGCATAPPVKQAVVNQRFYPSRRDEVFDRVLAVSTRNDMFVTASDRKSGVLTFERPVVAPDRTGAVYDWADCGAMSLLERPVSQLAELNMVIEAQGSGALVTVNSHFSELRQDVQHGTHRVNCTTTGRLEYEMLEKFAH